MSGDSVRRLLVTGPDENLSLFHDSVAMTLNAIERRQQTVAYTCMNGDYLRAAVAAERADVTLQEIDVVGEQEAYLVRFLGSHGWRWERPKSTV